MDSTKALEIRMERLAKIHKDAKKQLVVLEMREKDGQDVAEEREQLETVMLENQTRMQNTLEALEKLKELDQAEEE